MRFRNIPADKHVEEVMNGVLNEMFDVHFNPYIPSYYSAIVTNLALATIKYAEIRGENKIVVMQDMLYALEKMIISEELDD